MQAKELRIGNLVKAFDYKPKVEFDTIATITQYGWETVNGYNGIEPIPLTEEWLLKFGFKQWGDKYTFGLKGINIHHRQRGFVLRKSVPVIKYVHQLQNLYWCLCGEELTLK